MTYEEVKARLTRSGIYALWPGRRCAQPGRSTYLYARQNSVIALKYHNTDVVAWWPCGRVMLSSGNHRTATTKARINEYAPGCRLRQRRGVWNVLLVDDTGHMTAAGREFSDGMAYKNGRWLE